MKRKLLGATLLTAGTCIGAGMLALPVSAAPLGLGLALLLLSLAWLFMMYTGYLVLEANLWLKDKTSYISMARVTLGRPGEWVAWICFLLLLYSLMAAYITGGGALVNGLVYGAKETAVWKGYVPWVVVFSLIVYCGARFSDWMNRLLMLGLIATYILLAVSIAPQAKTHLVSSLVSLKALLAPLPIICASFGYHIIVPSMRHYLSSRVTLIKRMIFLGSFIPFIVYALWIVLIFGVVPRDQLLSILKSGQPTQLLTHTLSHISSHVWIADAARGFAFFAIASSFVGVSLGLFDLLADGLHIKRNHLGRGMVSVVTFVPPLIFALLFPKGFMIALGYAGVFVAILHGILPAAMVFAGRRKKLDEEGSYRVKGGLGMLLLVVLVSLVIIVAQLI